MAERYDVVLDGQLGERRGTLTWTETDGRLTGTFTLFGIDNPVIGRRSGAVLELTHTLRTAVSLLRCCTHADGVGLMTNYGGVYLGDRRLDELMAELDGRGALAAMHPTQSAVMVSDVNEEIPVPAFEYFVETTRAFLNMAQNDTFTTPNMLAFVVPAGDYEKEAALLTELESRGEIDHAVGRANTEAMDGYMLAGKLTPRQFSELAGLDYEMAQVVYAAEQGDYGKLMGNIASYKVPLIDMFLFVCEQADAGIIQLDAEQMSMLSDAQTLMRSAKA